MKHTGLILVQNSKARVKFYTELARLIPRSTTKNTFVSYHTLWTFYKHITITFMHVCEMQVVRPIKLINSEFFYILPRNNCLKVALDVSPFFLFELEY